MDRIDISYSSDETRQIGYQLGQKLPKNSIVCFFGDLGAGKTTLIQGLVAGATGCRPEEVNSPTFVYLNIYESLLKKVFHFDLYRLKNEEEFLSMGFEEFFQAGGICCVEWAERIEQLLPADCLSIKMTYLSEQERQIEIREGCLRKPGS